MRAQFEKEIGPYRLRKSAIMYKSWVEAAGGMIKGSKPKQGPAPPNNTEGDGDAATVTAAAAGKAAAAEAAAAVAATAAGVDDARVVVPLWLLKQSNDEQMAKLYALLRRVPEVIHWYLEEIVFPSFMQHQVTKLSSSGQEVGGACLFRHRIGFSGTPSDLLPLDLGRCGYERGSDGEMLDVLTSGAVVDWRAAEPGWTVESLLEGIASAQPPYHALIDTGALITGLGNVQVACFLLAHPVLGAWCEGVVFLSETDEKMILVKATGRVLKLAQCGIAKEKRFAFYDQVRRRRRHSALLRARASHRRVSHGGVRPRARRIVASRHGL